MFREESTSKVRGVQFSSANLERNGSLCLVDPLLLAAKPLLQGGLKSRAEIRSVALYQTPLQGRVSNSVSFHTALGYLSEL